MMKTFAFLAMLLCTAHASADTLYKCIDKESDAVLFTNQKSAGKQCKVLSTVDSGKPASVAATPSPADFPKVSNDAQKARDNTRRTILELELSNEQKSRDEALKLNDSNKVQLHERNIAALQKEIGNLK